MPVLHEPPHVGSYDLGEAPDVVAVEPSKVERYEDRFDRYRRQRFRLPPVRVRGNLGSGIEFNDAFVADRNELELVSLVHGLREELHWRPCDVEHRVDTAGLELG